MKKTLVGFSLLAAFLIMMLPTVAAEEAKVARPAVLSSIRHSLQTVDLEAMKEKYKDNPQPQVFLLTLLIMLLKLLRMSIALVGVIVLLIVLRLLGNNNNTTAIGC